MKDLSKFLCGHLFQDNFTSNNQEIVQMPIVTTVQEFTQDPHHVSYDLGDQIGAQGLHSLTGRHDQSQVREHS